MKFFIDNNLPPAFAKGLDGFSRGANFPTESVVHLQDLFPANAKDHEWIPSLPKDENWIIISQDGFRKNDLEREAIRRSGHFVIVLSKQWSHHSYWDKAQNFVKWWPAILDFVRKTHGSGAVRIPWRFSGKFEQIKI